MIGVTVLVSLYLIRPTANKLQALPPSCASLESLLQIMQCMRTALVIWLCGGNAAGWAGEIESAIGRYLKSLRWATNGKYYEACCADHRLRDQSFRIDMESTTDNVRWGQ